jgi:hypothetical protein
MKQSSEGKREGGIPHMGKSTETARRNVLLFRKAGGMLSSPPEESRSRNATLFCVDIYNFIILSYSNVCMD